MRKIKEKKLVDYKITEEDSENLETVNDDLETTESKSNIYKDTNVGKKGDALKESDKKKGKAGKVLLGIFITVIVSVFVVMGFGLFDESQILAPLENGKINVLLLGVDEEGLRTDAIMVASYDVNAAEVNMLSIPRDTKIYISNKKITRKINEIHAMSSKESAGKILGSEATAEAITQLTGIPINYYVEFSFSAIDRIFDILGPVEFDVPDVEGNGRGMNYDDPDQNLHIHLKPGLQKLSGNQVQQFLRYRKSNSGRGDGSDTSRVERQQEFLKAVIDQKVNAAILVKLPSLFKQISKEIVTNVSAGDITKYIRYVSKLKGEGIKTYSLPGESKNVGGGSYHVCDLEKTKQLMQEVFGFTSEITDKVTISDDHSQKILRAGNKSKATTTSQKETQKPTDTAENKDGSTKAPEVTKSPTKSPVETKEPTPVPTKKPYATPEPSRIPLEELDDEYQIID